MKNNIAQLIRKETLGNIKHEAFPVRTEKSNYISNTQFGVYLISRLSGEEAQEANRRLEQVLGNDEQLLGYLKEVVTAAEA